MPPLKHGFLGYAVQGWWDCSLPGQAHTAVDSTVTDTRLIVPQSTTVGVSRTFKVLVQPLAPAHSELGHSSTRIWNTLICRNDWSWMKKGRAEETREWLDDWHDTGEMQVPPIMKSQVNEDKFVPNGQQGATPLAKKKTIEFCSNYQIFQFSTNIYLYLTLTFAA